MCKDNVLLLQVLLLAMKDMNVAKLTAADLPLFNGIVSDLFPGVETPVMDYEKAGFHTFILKRNYLF